MALTPAMRARGNAARAARLAAELERNAKKKRDLQEAYEQVSRNK